LVAVFGTGWRLRAADATLLDAIRVNDANRVQTLLAGGADANSKDGTQASALMYAALYAGPRVLDLLVRAGADLAYRDKNGVTALTWAAHSYEAAKFLIEAGAGIDGKSNIGGTPLLMAAAYPGTSALLRLMLERGANIQTSVFGATPLMLAALTGDADSVAFLLKNGADPNGPAPSGLSAFDLAVMRGDRRIAQLLIDAGANLKMRQDRTRMFWNATASGMTRRWCE
jgi:ankyrin repeat protein